MLALGTPWMSASAVGADKKNIFTPNEIKRIAMTTATRCGRNFEPKHHIYGGAVLPQILRSRYLGILRQFFLRPSGQVSCLKCFCALGPAAEAAEIVVDLVDRDWPRVSVPLLFRRFFTQAELCGGVSATAPKSFSATSRPFIVALSVALCDVPPQPTKSGVSYAPAFGSHTWLSRSDFHSLDNGSKIATRCLWPAGSQADDREIMKVWSVDIEARSNGRHNSSGYRVNAHEIEPGIMYEDHSLVVTAFTTHHSEMKDSYRLTRNSLCSRSW